MDVCVIAASCKVVEILATTSLTFCFMCTWFDGCLRYFLTSAWFKLFCWAVVSALTLLHVLIESQRLKSWVVGLFLDIVWNKKAYFIFAHNVENGSLLTQIYDNIWLGFEFAVWRFENPRSITQESFAKNYLSFFKITVIFILLGVHCYLDHMGLW